MKQNSIIYSTGISDAIRMYYTRWQKNKNKFGCGAWETNKAFLSFITQCEIENKYIDAVMELLINEKI